MIKSTLVVLLVLGSIWCWSGVWQSWKDALHVMAGFENEDSRSLVDVSPHEPPTLTTTTTTTTTSTASKFADSAFNLSDYTQLYEPFRSYPCMPKRVHLSQADNVHTIPQPPDDPHFHHQINESVVTMTLSFSLDYQQCGPLQHREPKIYYRQGFHPQHTVEANAMPLQFNFTSSVNGTAFFQSDWIYHVPLPHVKAGNHRYWYRIEVPSNDNDNTNYVNNRILNDSQEEQEPAATSRRRLGATLQQPLLLGATPFYSFLSPPLPRTPTSIALVGDLGQTKNSTKTMAHIFHDSLPSNKYPTTLLLIAGDMAYADSDPLRWISWFDLMEPLTRTLPMHVAAGNHEIECDNATNEIFKHYEHYFHNPNRIAEADLQPITNEYRQSLWEQSCSTPSQFQGHYNYGNAFYSFIHGYIHFVILSSYSDSRVGSPQYEWLEHELKEKFNRTETPWLIVSFHSPLYTTFLGHVNETQAMLMKESMEPLFNQYHVNLVICGHDHGYMRTHSLGLNGTVDPTGTAPIYLTLGAGGNREQHSKGYLHEQPEEWVAQRDLRDYGYANLLVTNASHALLNWVRDGVSRDGVDDKNVWIINRHYNDTAGNSTIINGTLWYESDGTFDWPVVTPHQYQRTE